MGVEQLVGAAPDVAGEIVAWRAWVVRAGWTGPRLYSLNGEEWPDGAWMRASCRLGRIHDDSVPEERCGCGIYAARDRETLLSMGYWPPRNGDANGEYVALVVGEVGLVGKVIVADFGYRAERARPRRILLPHAAWRLGEGLRRLYRVEVELHNPFEQRGAQDGHW